MKIYLDVCCLCRPFDEVFSEKIKLEGEAVLDILEKCSTGKFTLLLSDLIEYEINKTPDIYKKEKALYLISAFRTTIFLDKSIFKRAQDLNNRGIQPMDALHLAAAEKGKADVFLTTDYLLLKKINNNNLTQISVQNPIFWLLEE